MNKELFKIIISAALFCLSCLCPNETPIYFLLIVLSYIIVSFEVFVDAFKKLFSGQLFDENLLMIIATISAFWIGEYPEAVMVMLLFEFGEYLSNKAVSKSKASITSLMDLRSDIVNLKRNNDICPVSVKEAKINDAFVVKPGEKIPLDGVVISGESFIDTSNLTGESVPKLVKKGDDVLSGTINESSILTVRVTKTSEFSTANKIIELIENSSDKKTNTEKFITRFARIYTPAVVLLAFLIVVIPTSLGNDFDTWFYRALVFLVTSCPCAIVISIPLSYFCGIGRASKEGILIKGSNELERLNHIKALVLDKTGTLTKGNFEVVKIVTNKLSSDEMIKIMAHGEYYSNHPIAMSIQRKYNKKIDKKIISDFKEISGKGVKVKINNDNIIIGTEKFLNEENIHVPKTKEVLTTIFLARNNEFIGYVVIADEIKDYAYKLTDSLSKEGITRVVVLSGDNLDIVSNVCNQLKINEYYANLLPADKVKKLNEIKKNNKVAFVGDGVNDAPVIKISDIGIAMGGLGSDAALEAADVVLIKDDLSKIPTMKKISKITQKTVICNIVFALTIKFIMLVLATFGLTTIWMAVFADVGVTLIAIFNALTIMKRRI